MNFKIKNANNGGVTMVPITVFNNWSFWAILGSICIFILFIGFIYWYISVNKIKKECYKILKKHNLKVKPLTKQQKVLLYQILKLPTEEALKELPTFLEKEIKVTTTK